MPWFYLVMQIPNWFGGEDLGSTIGNPFSLPEAYMASQQKNVCVDFFLVNLDFWVAFLVLDLLEF